LLETVLLHIQEPLELPTWRILVRSSPLEIVTGCCLARSLSVYSFAYPLKPEDRSGLDHARLLPVHQFTESRFGSRLRLNEWATEAQILADCRIVQNLVTVQGWPGHEDLVPDLHAVVSKDPAPRAKW
jgi:hypothetical protein